MGGTAIVTIPLNYREYKRKGHFVIRLRMEECLLTKKGDFKRRAWRS